ncbi:hypothetical protein HK097_002675 [Rhizophlyctis rosea]|uniref:Uncharacterized protein n=1 Tax=Rhizophlyctis rosea TaxID=64517 RepID=A0AAD5SH29_9FUNG|nr:hypothetical protein HK097_002675 [Rhizophlyctis rosea]
MMALERAKLRAAGKLKELEEEELIWEKGRWRPLVRLQMFSARWQNAWKAFRIVPRSCTSLS